MKRIVILLCLLMSSCSTLPPTGSCRDTCDAVIAVQEERYQVCQSHVKECTEALKKTSPDLIPKIVYGVIGLGVGALLGVRLSR